MKPLTPPEALVLSLLAEGRTQKQAAREMDRSHKTVNQWALRAREKLGAQTVLQAAVLWAKK